MGSLQQQQQQQQQTKLTNVISAKQKEAHLSTCPMLTQAQCRMSQQRVK
jgi:hypothetical protein